MSRLTEQEYEEYIRLLRAWVEAEKALEGPEPSDAEAAARAREAYAAVALFRQQHRLAGEGSWAPQAAPPLYSRRQQRQAEA